MFVSSVKLVTSSVVNHVILAHAVLPPLKSLRHTQVVQRTTSTNIRKSIDQGVPGWAPQDIARGVLPFVEAFLLIVSMDSASGNLKMFDDLCVEFDSYPKMLLLGLICIGHQVGLISSEALSHLDVMSQGEAAASIPYLHQILELHNACEDHALLWGSEANLFDCVGDPDLDIAGRLCMMFENTYWKHYERRALADAAADGAGPINPIP